MTYTLWHGDCLTQMDRIEAGSVDLVIIDPPYFMPSTHYSVRSGSYRSLSDLGVLEYFFAGFFTAVRRVLKSDGFLYVFCDGQSYPVFYVTAYKHFRKMRPIVWDKMVSINGYGWRHQHELIIFCESEHSPHIKTGDGDILKHRAVLLDDREHLAEKPVGLLERIINKHSDTAIVLDSFMGSGSTGEACLRTGRRFIGIEKDAGYFEIATQRLARVAAELRGELNHLPLFAEAA